MREGRRPVSLSHPTGFRPLRSTLEPLFEGEKVLPFAASFAMLRRNLRGPTSESMPSIPISSRMTREEVDAEDP